jgi:hypothetical protein
LGIEIGIGIGIGIDADAPAGTARAALTSTATAARPFNDRRQFIIPYLLNRDTDRRCAHCQKNLRAS